MSAGFKTPLVMSPVDNGARWRIEKPLVFDSSIIGRVIVPKGFECDLKSLPRLAWIVAPKTAWPEAGCVHDWLYATVRVTRADADAVYREALGVLGVGVFRREVRYWALRLFGGGAFRGASASVTSQGA